MSLYHLATLSISLVGFGVTLAAFGLLAPWYKSKTGIVLFFTIFNLWLLLWSAVFYTVYGPEYQWERYVRNTVYTLTAVNSIALPIVVLRIQIVGYRARRLAETIIRGSPLPPDVLPPRSQPPQ
jgi:hypothetical protein